MTLSSTLAWLCSQLPPLLMSYQAALFGNLSRCLKLEYNKSGQRGGGSSGGVIMHVSHLVLDLGSEVQVESFIP